MTSRRPPKGFTMAELLVAVTLMAVVLAGLFALQDTLLRDQGKVLRDIAVRNQADFIRRMMLRDIEESTVIQSPAAGGSSTNLIGFKNLDPYNINCGCSGACLPNAVCAAACAGAAINQRQNWTSLVDLPKDVAGFPDPGGSGAADGARLYGNDTTWFRYCLTTDNRLMYFRGVLRAGVNDIACPVTGACNDAGCGGINSPNCVAEEIAGTPVRVNGGFTGGNVFRRIARQDWIEANIEIATTTTMGGLAQSTSVQVLLSGQMLRGVR